MIRDFVRLLKQLNAAPTISERAGKINSGHRCNQLLQVDGTWLLLPCVWVQVQL